MQLPQQLRKTQLTLHTSNVNQTSDSKCDFIKLLNHWIKVLTCKCIRAEKNCLSICKFSDTATDGKRADREIGFREKRGKQFREKVILSDVGDVLNTGN